MKELTIKEKAEAYDKAIEAARCIYNNMKDGGNFGGMEDLEVIFPELKENGDERIRKALLEMVHDTTGDSLWVDYDVHKEDALAWLEKQGQVRCTGIGKKEETGTLKKMLDDEEMKTLLRTEYEKGKADAIVEMQKSWSEEDERKLTDVIVALSEYANGNIPYILPSILLEDVDWLKSLRHNCKFEDLEGDITWCRDKIFDKDVEYIRTDAFIEKACRWFKNNWRKYVNTDKDGVVCFGHWEKDFENYMKG